MATSSVRHFPPREATWRARGSAVHGVTRRDAPVGARRHPAPLALIEIMVHPRPGAGADEEGDGLLRGHEAGLVQADADRVPGAETEQLALRGNVPRAIARADAVGHSQAEGDPRLAEQVVDVL